MPSPLDALKSIKPGESKSKAAPKKDSKPASKSAPSKPSPFGGKPKAAPADPMTGMMGGAEGASDLEDQGSAGYLPPEDGPFECQHCAHFKSPNACDKVSGVIDPQGCCNYYLSVETGSDNPGGESSADADEAGMGGGLPPGLMGMIGG